MKDEYGGNIIDEFIGLKSKMYSIKKIDGSESSTAKGVNIAEYKGVKIAEFPETSIEMKNCKTFYKVQTASRLRKFFSLIPPPIPPDKLLLRL